MSVTRTNLMGMSRDELSALAVGAGEPAYRGGQLYTWLYAKGATAFAPMTDLGRPFRMHLEETAEIRGVSTRKRRVSRRDGTVKFLFGLHDGLGVESVLIPPATSFKGGEAAKEDEQLRFTLCVSTQVGCPLDCAFCATGTMGFLRNLTTGEIVDQLLQTKRESARTITNVVFMGMGEPLLNYDAVLAAAEIMSTGAGIASRRITVSTAGLPDRIRRLADEGRRIKLAVSLHSAVNETRSRLMPINRKFSLETLIDAIEHYYHKTGERVTYEVILFGGVNDGDRDIDRLIRLARRVPSKINVIPFHSIGFTRPSGFPASLGPSSRQEKIVGRLREADLTVMVRSSAGEDIEAACGQLAISPGRGHRRGSDAA
jgi:23S rRNA (adenine2503-C2)-methyltransferase